MKRPYVSYYEVVDFDETKLKEWHPHNNNFGVNILSFVIGVSFRDDSRKSMSLFDFYLVHEDFFEITNATPNVPDWVFRGEFSWPKVYKAIDSFVEGCIGETEAECFDKLRKKMFWEYDGYDGLEPITPKKMIYFIE